MANMFAVKSNLSFLMVQLDTLKLDKFFPREKVTHKLKATTNEIITALYIQSTLY